MEYIAVKVNCYITLIVIGVERNLCVAYMNKTLSVLGVGSDRTRLHGTIAPDAQTNF